MYLQSYQVQTLAIRDTVHPAQQADRRESNSFPLRDLPHILILPFWIASVRQRPGIISFTAIIRAIPTHMKILQMGDQSIVSDAGFFFQEIILPQLHGRSK